MISVIVPTYNERKNLEELAERVFKALNKVSLSGELIIVDDNSADGTGELAEELKKKFNITVLRRKGKKGLASAVLDGFKIAKGDIFCVMDADLSHPPEAIPILYEVIKKEEAEIAVGSRLVPGGGSTNWPWYRKIVSQVARLLAKPLTNVKDLTSGYFMAKKSVVDGAALNPIGFKILLEILAKGNYNKATEIPIVFVNREGGKSKLGTKEIFEYLKQVYVLYIDMLQGKIKRKGR